MSLGSSSLQDFALEDAMRRKWRRCRCAPLLSPHADFACCRCILLMPTQEWIQSPSSSYSLPSDLVESPRSGPDLNGQFTEEQIAVLTAIVKKLEEQDRRYCENEPWSHRTELIDDEATTVLISGGDGITKTARERSSLGDEGETEDTASSGNLNFTP
ncbi:hypothetical protein KC19_VG132800 [Ceratodon purpureus]|uniref:Uncharacterized protein n=1 Tax=Ceratodon purpureus TaxID=3225 RepID=A0A8T0HQR4_CERPU|nr:hypothetical protein KC19_VG132800 [Ceratodon purpureus]